MTPKFDIDPRIQGQSRTLSSHAGRNGYTVVESADRFWRERAAENALRLTAMVLIVVGYVQWFIPTALLDGDDMLNRIMLLALFTATGILLYLFASRGFRKQLRLDVGAGTLSFSRVNARNRSLSARKIPLGQIESIFVSRASDRHRLANLQLRLRGRSDPIIVMRGGHAELEALHGHLCRDIRLTQVPPAQPRRQRTPPSPRAVRDPQRETARAASPKTLFAPKQAGRGAPTFH